MLGGTVAWVGGSDSASEGNWKWMDGPEANLGVADTQLATFWTNGTKPPDPSSSFNCLVYIANGYWTQSNCAISRYFVIEYERTFMRDALIFQAFLSAYMQLLFLSFNPNSLCLLQLLCTYF